MGQLKILVSALLFCVFTPMFSDGWIALEKMAARGFTHRIQGAREVHTFRTQKQLERREEGCVGQKV